MANEHISASTAEKIREKAESNTPLLQSTPEKQQMFDAYQAQYVQKINDKASTGEQLMRPNAWKDEMYQRAQQQQLFQQMQSQQQQYSPDAIMGRQQSGNDDRMRQLEQMLQQGANATYDTQKSQLDATLNQQLTDLQSALEEAVANGEMSIREAHAAFEENKGSIQQQAYQDSESTKLQAQDRGIQNSQQMLGLQQGDNVRRDSMLNKNMTERDRRVADVKDRLNAIKNTSKLQMGSAQAQHGYGLAGARGQADAQMYQNQFNMGLENYKMDREQQFQLDKSGMDQANQMQMQQQQQVYQLQQLTTQQKYTLEQFAIQNGYDLNKMGTDQVYRLAQMATQNGYDLGMQQNQQQFQGGQNALDRGQQWNMQQSQQGFQGNQNALDRTQQWNMQGSAQSHAMSMQTNAQSHDKDMLSVKNRAEVDSMEAAMQMELSSYTDKDSDAYKLREAQMQSSIDALYKESHAKLISDVMGKTLVDQVGSMPVHPGSGASRKKLEEYNAQVEGYNNKMAQFFDNPGNIDEFYKKLPTAAYSDSVKGSFSVPNAVGLDPSQVDDETRRGSFLRFIQNTFLGTPKGGTP